MNQIKIPLKLIRGGTSKGLYIKTKDFPDFSNMALTNKIILNLMGSPDPYGLQIDGLGTGISSTSKVALISKIKIDGKSYLNYNFGQVSVKDNNIDYSGNCGNLASGLFEFIQGDEEYSDCLEDVKSELSDKYTDCLRVWQENKQHKMFIYGTLKSKLDSSKDENKMKISGVGKAYNPIFVEMVDLTPEGKSLFPTGNPKDKVKLLNSEEEIEITYMEGANPLIFINPKDIYLKGNELPKDINYNLIENRIESIVKSVCSYANIEYSNSLRVCWVSEPTEYFDSSNMNIKESEYDIVSRINAFGRVHHAHTATGAINIAIACGIEGTIPYEKVKKIKDKITIGHPGGLMTVEAKVKYDKEKKLWKALSGGFIRNARVLMKGESEISLD